MKSPAKAPAPGLGLVGTLGGRRSTFRLRPGLNQIGRGRQSTVRLTEQGISKRHANLVVQDGWLYFEDLASKNGTFYNGRPARQGEARPGTTSASPP